jgi:hypothetical protein
MPSAKPAEALVRARLDSHISGIGLIFPLSRNG